MGCIYFYARNNSQYATASVMVQLANGKKKTARSSYTIEIFKLDKANIPRERVAVGAKENIKIAQTPSTVA